MIFVFLSSCLNQKVENVNNVFLRFNGAKDDFYMKYGLHHVLFQDSLIELIIYKFESSKPKLFCGSIRPVMWEISVYANSEKKNNRIFSIISNTDDRVSLMRGNTCYDNQELVDLIIKLMKVDEIRAFDGPMTQADYLNILATQVEH